jgi:hypothetical protein
MDDSVGPVVKAVKSFPSAEAGKAGYVEVDFSEAVPLDVAAGIFPLEVKRGMGMVADGEIKVASILALSPSKYRITFTPDSKYPVPGDSSRIAAARPVKDAAGNRSNMRFYVPVTGDPPRASGDLNVGLVEGVTKGPVQIILGAIPNPVVVHGKQTCVNCGDAGIQKAIPGVETGKITAIGPTWKVMTKYPFKYTMSFFDNLGQFVNKAEGEVDPDAFEKLRATEKVGDSVLVELTFLPVSFDGSAIGTGAYIMKGLLQIQDQKGLKGPQGETITLVPTERTIVSRFGYIRNP